MPSREDAIQRAITYLDTGMFQAELAELVAIPSESQTSAGFPHCLRYLKEAMQPAFTDMGFDCQVFDNPVSGGGPIMLATRIEGAGLPTVLGYGHGDVIHGMAETWNKGAGPWQLAREGDRLYGRGTADNKGQHLINMRAMQAVLQERGSLGFNAKFLIETGEEIGSLGLREVIAANLAAFAADVFVASDGPRVKPNRPTLSLGCRGALNFDLVCDMRKGGHHSGNWGGALVDPATVLAHAIATIVSPTGEILVPEWRPEPIRPLLRELLANVVLDGGVDGPQIDNNWGEPGLSAVENVYAWNSFAVLAMLSGNPQNPVNAIAPNAQAHCQLRFIKGTYVNEIVPALRRHLDARGFQNVIIQESDASADAGFAASRTEPDDPWVIWAKESIVKTTGTEPAVVPQMGGSICNELFTDLLGLPTLWFPHSYVGCSQHAPDEHVLLPTCRSALGLMAGLYWDLGASDSPYFHRKNAPTG
jgi:acetylornithine deacetylase/succinyl-diaminopimelate desuccinylase-like protein